MQENNTFRLFVLAVGIIVVVVGAVNYFEQNYDDMKTLFEVVTKNRLQKY